MDEQIIGFPTTVTPIEEAQHEKIPGVALNVYRQAYAVTCLPDAEWQRGKLESLRARFGNYFGHGRPMQRLGDFGRKWLPGLNFRLRY